MAEDGQRISHRICNHIATIAGHELNGRLSSYSTEEIVEGEDAIVGVSGWRALRTHTTCPSTVPCIYQHMYLIRLPLLSWLLSSFTYDIIMLPRTAERDKTQPYRQERRIAQETTTPLRAGFAIIFYIIKMPQRHFYSI